MSSGSRRAMAEAAVPLRPASPATSPLRGEELRPMPEQQSVSVGPHPTEPAARAGSPSPASGEGKSKIRILSVLVEDHANTLTKVSGAIRRRGFQVRGIWVGPSREPGRFRITLQVDHGHAEADQVRKQLERLVEVVEVEDLTGDDVHSRELVVAKVSASELHELVKRGARVISTA